MTKPLNEKPSKTSVKSNSNAKQKPTSKATSHAVGAPKAAANARVLEAKKVLRKLTHEQAIIQNLNPEHLDIYTAEECDYARRSLLDKRIEEELLVDSESLPQMYEKAKQTITLLE